MNKPILQKRTKRKYHQGVFNPQNPLKYIGDITKIVYRSKWELKFMQWCDTNPYVIKYASEEVVIPYISPIDGKQHRYFMDFYVEVQDKDNKKKTYLIEIKPFAQTIIPKIPKKGTLNENYQESIKTYMVNQAKWEAARNYCKSRGWIFQVLTEKELFKK